MQRALTVEKFLVRIPQLVTFWHIGVIYGGTRSTGTPTFRTEGYSTPQVLGRKVKNLLSPAVNRSDLQRLSYAPDPAETAHDTLPDPRVGWEGDTSSPFPPLSLRTHGCLVLLLNRYPHFQTKVTPLHSGDTFAANEANVSNKFVGKRRQFRAVAFAALACLRLSVALLNINSFENHSRHTLIFVVTVCVRYNVCIFFICLSAPEV